MNLLDQDQFDINDPRWRELVRVLAELCPRPSDALSLTGKRKRDVTSGMSSLAMWAQLLSLLAPEGGIRRTIDAAFQRFRHDPRSSFLADMINGVEEASSTRPKRKREADEEVGELEALLFLDDLTMPAGRIPQLIETLRKLLAVSPAVCLLRVGTSAGQLYGTGFRIARNLVLTNNHVLAPAKRTVTDVIADFEFDVDDAGKSKPVVSLTGDISSVVGEPDDDWAVIMIKDLDTTRLPIIDLSELPVPIKGESAFIIQHPEGKQKRLGFVRNTISDVDAMRIRYLTDTQKGSSGAPVFDAYARPIALHFAGGKPTNFPGKIPVVKNSGIRMSRVVARLKAKGLIL